MRSFFLFTLSVALLVACARTTSENAGGSTQAQARYVPGNRLSWGEYFQEWENFFAEHERFRTADQLVVFNRAVVREIAPALHTVLTHPKSRVFYGGFTPPLERLASGFYKERHDDAAGLRMIWQLELYYPSLRSTRLLSAILFLDYNPKTGGLKFVGPNTLKLPLGEGALLRAKAPDYVPRVEVQGFDQPFFSVSGFLRRYLSTADRFRIERMLKKNKESFPGPDSLRVRAEVATNKFAGLSFSARQHKSSFEVLELEPGMYTTNEAELIYHNVTVWSRTDHCVGCHRRVGRTMLTEDEIQLAQKKAYTKMDGFQSFLKYAQKTFRLSDVETKRLKNRLLNPSRALPEGLIPAAEYLEKRTNP